MDRVLQEMLVGDEVGVKDGDELALGHFHPFLQRAGLVALAVLAVQVGDVHALGLVLLDAARGDGHGLVGGIVQDLYFQELPGIIHFHYRVDQALGHVHLVVHRQLDGHPRQFLELALGLGRGLLVLIVQIDHKIAVRAENGQDRKHHEIKHDHKFV